MPDETVIAYHSRKVEPSSKRSSKKDADYESNPCFDSEDAFSDTSFSTLSAGTEDGLMSNLDEDDELQPTIENELLELNKIMTDVDASLRTKILSEVESLIAKYRKCLSNAVQGKKLYQMELEKVHYSHRAKIHKLRETNKHLEDTLRKFQGSPVAIKMSSEHSENSNSRMSLNHSNPQSQDTENIEITTLNIVNTSCESSLQTAESDCTLPVATTETVTITTEENRTVLSSSTLPKQSPNPDAEPLGK